MPISPARIIRSVQVPAGEARLDADLGLPPDAAGLVIFAHGSGSSRLSARNRFVADYLNGLQLATLLLDLLSASEGQVDERTRELRFDIPLLAERVVQAMEWAQTQHELSRLPIGLFGASTGAAAALIAAAERPALVRTVVSRGGRPDLAGDALARVACESLFLVGGADEVVLQLNHEAAQQMRVRPRLVVIPGATHLFEEPGTLELVADHAGRWLQDHLAERAAEEQTP